MKKILLIFLILSTLAIGKEVENVNIFVNPNVKLSQSELNKDKEEIKKEAYDLINFFQKVPLKINNHEAENGKEMEKKILKDIDKDINFDNIIDLAINFKKYFNNYDIVKHNIESIEIITEDTAKVKISRFKPNISVINAEYFNKNIMNLIDKNLKENVSFFNKENIKIINENLKKFINEKTMEYIKNGNLSVEFQKINGIWEISKLDGMDHYGGQPMKDESDFLDKLELSNSSDNNKLSRLIGKNLSHPEIVEGIVLYKEDSRFSISNNEIKDIVKKSKKINEHPFKIKILKNNKLILSTVVVILRENNKKGVQFNQFEYEKENGKWEKKNTVNFGYQILF